MLRWAPLAALWIAIGCYSPSVRDCTVSCASEGDCTGGQVCARGWCAAPDHSCEGGPPANDATTATSDAPPTDLCVLGCTNGTCSGGVCVIDCSASDTCTGRDLECPPNIPCRVVCGDRSCDKKVLCEQASTCEVVCSGTDACADEILCGMNRPCDVTCSGEGSCKKRLKCKEACSCDATCTGVGSCAELPECPSGDVCRLGNGCSSVLESCDRCDP